MRVAHSNPRARSDTDEIGRDPGRLASVCTHAQSGCLKRAREQSQEGADRLCKCNKVQTICFHGLARHTFQNRLFLSTSCQAGDCASSMKKLCYVFVGSNLSEQSILVFLVELENRRSSSSLVLASSSSDWVQ